MREPFVAVIGAGQVGATTAQRLIEKEISDVVLFDVVDGLAEGKALDLMQAASVEGHGRRVVGTTSFEACRGAEIVVVTAGLARKPGMNREDLLAANVRIVSEVCDNIIRYTPAAKVIMVTNPLDIMTHLAWKRTGFACQRVIGMAGVLDSARMRYFVAAELGLKPCDVEAMVLGGHGDLMVALMSAAKAGGRPISEILSQEKILEIEKLTQNGGAQIVALLKSGSAYYAPASSVTRMVEAILQDQKCVLPVCAYVEAAYGIKGLYFGVPAALGKNGVERVIEIAISESERATLQLSAQKVAAGILELEAMMGAAKKL